MLEKKTISQVECVLVCLRDLDTYPAVERGLESPCEAAYPNEMGSDILQTAKVFRDCWFE